MKLNIGNDTVIHFDVRSGSSPSVSGLNVLGCEVNLPMLVCNRLWIIRYKRWSGKNFQATTKHQQAQQAE